MKKILYSILAFGLVLPSCTKEMNDIDDQIKEIQEKEQTEADFLRTRPAAPAAYTLTDADYELSSDADVAKYKNFSAAKPAKDYLPEILYQLFSGQDGQSLMTTYKYYSRPFVDMDNSRSITEEEYMEMGQKYGNFGNEDEAEALIGRLLDRKEYADAAGTEMTVDYILYKSNQTRYVQVNAADDVVVLDYSADAIELTDAQYEELGHGKYKNFDDIDQAVAELPTLSGQTFPATYAVKVYRNYLTTYAVFFNNGMNWVVKQSVNEVSEELNYSRDAEDITMSFWWADPAIKITLTAADYALNDATSKYLNFDLRSGQTPGTDVALRVQMIGEMLDANHGPIVEGEQYLVTYDYYDGASGSASDRIIKQNGAWSMYE